MKKHNALIAEDTQALRKLDAAIEKDDPFAKEPGGNAYVAKTAGVARIEQMYDDKLTGYNTKKTGNKKTEILIVIGVASILLILMLVLLNI